MSDAFVVVPGGIGTALETLMIWQLLQVRHLADRTPFILIWKMYADLVEWARKYMLRPQFPLASPEDMNIPLCLSTPDEAIAVIRKHYKSWQKEQGPRKSTVRSKRATGRKKG